MKKTDRVISVVLDALLWLLISLAVSIPLSNAGIPQPPPPPPPPLVGGAAIFGSAFNVGPNEIAACTGIADNITRTYSGQRYSATNYYGGATTVSKVLDVAWGTGCDYWTLFHVGEGYYWNWYWLLGYTVHYAYADNAGQWIKDNEVYSKTGSSRYYFVFLWSCEQGDVIGGDDSHTGAVGMPYAWHHTNALSTNGYTTPDNGAKCFIGFNGIAPQFTDPNQGTNCRNFILNFYACALRNHFSIKVSLDTAARRVWGVNTFADSFLYRGFIDPNGKMGHMIVYGNGNIVLRSG